MSPTRPKIVGVAHIAFYVSDLAASRVFYTDFLGYEESYQINHPDGSLALAVIKINDRQYVELHPGLKPGQDRLQHIAFYVDDAEAMRVYLASRGVTVPDRVTPGRRGTTGFSVQDPENHAVQFVQGCRRAGRCAMPASFSRPIRFPAGCPTSASWRATMRRS